MKGKSIRTIVKMRIGEVKASDGCWYTVVLALRSLLEPVLEALQIQVNLDPMTEGEKIRARSVFISFALLLAAYRGKEKIAVNTKDGGKIEVLYKEADEETRVTHYAPPDESGTPLAPEITFYLSDDVLKRAMELRDLLLALRDKSVKLGFNALVTMAEVRGRVPKTEAPATKKCPNTPDEKRAVLRGLYEGGVISRGSFEDEMARVDAEAAKAPKAAPAEAMPAPEAPKAAPREPLLPPEKVAELRPQVEADMAKNRANRDATKAAKKAAKAERVAKALAKAELDRTSGGNPRQPRPNGKKARKAAAGAQGEIEEPETASSAA
ncbi:MAG: hypothetical protein PHW53_01715 [Patescibacteria group bacterium]|nr:hypothetical protein [Patescibacteria group bacterium]